METVSTISLYAALGTTGLMAGTYLAFSIAVLLGIARTHDNTFVTSMRGMNAAILNPVSVWSSVGRWSSASWPSPSSCRRAKQTARPPQRSRSMSRRS